MRFRILSKTALVALAALIGNGFLQAAGVPGAGVAQADSTRQQAVTAHQPASPSSIAASLGSQDRALVDRYCVTCHNQRLKTAGLTLDTLNVEHLDGSLEVLEKVVRKLKTGGMPPPGLPRPDRVVVDDFVSRLETALDLSAAVKPNPGRPAIHRLNRIEYVNAIRDLLGLEIDGKSLLPADNSGFGFDNIADVLSVSPALLERYVLAAQKIARLAVGDPTMPLAVESYKVPFFHYQENRMSDDLPAGSRGGIAVRHYFPLDGEYTFRIHLQTQRGGRVRGLAQPNVIDVRLDGVRLKLFIVGGKPTTDPDQDAPVNKGGASELMVRVPIKAGSRLVGVAFQRKTSVPEGVGPSRLPAASFGFSQGTDTSPENGKIDAGIDRLDIEGPFGAQVPQETPSRRRIFTCQPTRSEDELPCARTILMAIARRAYRRPVTQDDVGGLLGFFKAGRADSSFDTGIQRALEAVLADPEFLFRIEREPANVPAGAAYRLDDLDLAARLSFFLWSSIPDDTLLDLAVRGELRRPAALEQQVQRMLGDPRSKVLVTNFFGQWLSLRDVAAVTPDPKAFPEFDEELRQAFQRETELFLESQLRDDHSVLELLTADYTFVNERLARHYGIPHVYGSHFRRVAYGDDTRAGLLGHGSILTVTSYADRTSPVLRGKWLLDNLLGAPPPAPPANVPPFPENQGDARPKSVRERLEEHRKNPVCASCHARIDPMGFPLEHFDGIGKWRTTDAGAQVNVSGTLPDGSTFGSFAEFRKVLLTNHREEFVTTLIEKLMTYAVGRGMEYFDMPAIRTITREAASNNYRWSSIVLGVIKSMPFQMRRAAS